MINYKTWYFGAKFSLMGKKLTELYVDGNFVALVTSEFQEPLNKALKLQQAVSESYERYGEKVSQRPKSTDNSPEAFNSFIVDSTWISKVGYDSKKNRMMIVKAGQSDEQAYVYKDVPKNTFNRVLYSSEFEGVGEAYNALIKGKFELEEK